MTQYRIDLTDDQALDLASGYVPNAIKATLTLMLECDEEDRRRAERPVKKTRSKNADTPTD